MAERELVRLTVEHLQGSVPEELLAYPHFVLWRPVEIQGKVKKIPVNPHTGESASPTDPATWGSFADVLKAYARGAGQGIGFVFAEDDPFTGTDLDRCVENTGEIAPWARAIVSQLDSYTEYSPSGTGLHIITQAHIPAGRRTDHTEIYSTGRYFTLTGNHLTGTPTAILSRQEPQETLYHFLDDQSVRKVGNVRPQVVFRLTRHDEEVLAKATNARNADKFLPLWEGKTEGFRSKSEADFTLVLYLLYWTNDDIEQTKRLFRKSGLYDEEKTDSLRGKQTYLDVTIENALRKRGKR